MSKEKLTEYWEKRDFKKTKEPKGKARKSKEKERIFVIQKHLAKRLHYDFRLEDEGVLKSWAVPKEPPKKSGVKRLAMAVEAHPLKYAEFEGCFEFYTKVITESGTQNIGNIVNDKRKVNVLSYNSDLSCLEWKPVIGWFKNGQTKDFLRIRVPGQYGGRRIITVTPKHKIFTPQGMRQAEDLSQGDSIYVPGYKWSEEQKQILFGTLLGDASMECQNNTRTPCFSLVHSGKQRRYLEFIRDQLAPQATIRVSLKSDSHRFRFTAVSLVNTYHLFYPNKKKHVSKELLSQLDERGLAVWYMGNGYLSNKKFVELCTQGFTQKENELIADFLNDKWQFGAKVYYQKPRKKSTGGCLIHLNRLGSIRFLTLINDYLLPELRYKTYIDKFSSKWHFEKGKNDIVPVKIAMIEKASRKKIRSQQKFDIMIEDNHNYFAGSVLVANSIPPGLYGAGKVEIWDKGKYELLEKEKNKYAFVLHGKKLKGKYFLTRFEKAAKNGWLLFKAKEQ